VHLCAGTYLHTDDGYNDSIPNGITIEGDGVGSTILDGAGDYYFFSLLLTSGGEDHVTIGGITFRNGYDSSYAGAFDVENGAVYIANCSFINNRSGDYGGALYFERSALTITNTSFTDNATGNDGGGAIYVYQAPSAAVITNSSFTHNGAAFGGAIVARYSDLEVTNSTFSNNYTDYERAGADYGGAAIYVYDSYTRVTGSTFVNNESPQTGSGAGILVYTGSLSVDRSTFTGNRAGQAPAIYSYGDDNSGEQDSGEFVTVTNSTFSNNKNTANDDSGAIGHERNGRDLTLIGNTFKRNSGAYWGGAVEAWLVGGDLTIKNNRFIGNRADEGGALWIDVRGGTTDIRKNTFTLNRARRGGAISFECEAVSPRTVVRNLTRQNRFSDNAGGDVFQSKYVTSGGYCSPGG
jgi:predicted outer membrane repeat protein